jgi:hypothetical protein
VRCIAVFWCINVFGYSGVWVLSSIVLFVCVLLVCVLLVYLCGIVYVFLLVCHGIAGVFAVMLAAGWVFCRQCAESLDLLPPGHLRS